MADIKIGIMRECPQVMTPSFLEEPNEQGREKKWKEERQTDRMNFFINGKIPLRNGSGLDDKQHLFILFGDGDKLFPLPEI